MFSVSTNLHHNKRRNQVNVREVNVLPALRVDLKGCKTTLEFGIKGGREHRAS